ncbi:TPA: AlpA family phage regulatory protein [Salmonella enterica]|uniref:AlpA family phage regulatory protein n=1 Tax=Salmonella enterica TaxID=28901 RepID=A0A759YM21_SALER|nr:AlpA family phage regulatory protein [Salmonella enterica subsp. enterica serovar Newport]HAG2284971.1 AlpA family phage regulatory protein [Salmonella enterica]
MKEFKFMTKNELELMPDIERMVKEGECAWLSGTSRRARAHMENKGEFPKRLHLGGRAIGWRLSEVQAWIKGEWKPEDSQTE